MPGPIAINERFARFASALPDLCDESGLDRNDLQFVAYVAPVEAWLRVDKEVTLRRTRKLPRANRAGSK